MRVNSSGKGWKRLKERSPDSTCPTLSPANFPIRAPNTGGDGIAVNNDNARLVVPENVLFRKYGFKKYPDGPKDH